MQTLLEANKFNQELLQKGVVEMFARSNAILETLPFRTINGNSYSYVREKTLPGVEFRSVNSGYTESTPEVDRLTERLSIFGGDSIVDKYLVATSNLTDIRAFNLEMKVKQMAKTFGETFINGDSGVDPNVFDGINKRMDPTQVVDAAETEISLGMLHELMDAVDGGADLLITTKSGKRELQRIFDLHPSYLQVGINSFGETITSFNDVRIVTLSEDTIPFRPAAVTGEISDLFAVRMGSDGVTGLQNGNGIRTTDVGELETKPAFLTRVEWYCSIMLQNPKAIAKLSNFLRAV
jgi:hypothetical protein